ncbi:hypothetical protein MRX96_041068 [Rhipicephalus microplus]
MRVVQPGNFVNSVLYSPNRTLNSFNTFAHCPEPTNGVACHNVWVLLKQTSKKIGIIHWIWDNFIVRFDKGHNKLWFHAQSPSSQSYVQSYASGCKEVPSKNHILAQVGQTEKFLNPGAATLLYLAFGRHGALGLT